jgi:hypothetical protein
MAESRREPIWNVIAIALQVVGVMATIAVGAEKSKPDSLEVLLYAAPTYAGFCLLGAVAAGVALARRERWLPLSFIALFVNGIPAVILLSVILQKVRL